MEENILGFGFTISVLGQGILIFNERLKDFNLCAFVKFFEGFLVIFLILKK